MATRLTRIFLPALLIALTFSSLDAFGRRHTPFPPLLNSAFIDHTVEVYDAFVRLKMGDSLPIDEAYRRFFNDNTANISYAGELWDSFRPDSTFVYRWTSDFVGGSLQNSLIAPCYLSPSNLYYFKHTGGWRFKILPDFGRFGKTVGKSNRFWTRMTKEIMASGGFSPGYYTLVYSAKEINFEDKRERFMAVIGFMTGCFYHRDFILVKDAALNDTLEAEWELELNRRSLLN